MSQDAVLRVSPEVHARVKAASALSRMTIKEWVEGVLQDALDGKPSPSVLIDTREPYSTKEAE